MYEKAKRDRSPKWLALAIVAVFMISLLAFAVSELQAQTICDVYPEAAGHLRDVFGPECENPTMVQPEYLELQPGCMVMFSFPGIGENLVGAITGYKWNTDTHVYEYWVLYDFPRPAENWGGGWAASDDVVPLGGENCDTGS